MITSTVQAWKRGHLRDIWNSVPDAYIEEVVNDEEQGLEGPGEIEEERPGITIEETEPEDPEKTA